MDLPDELGPLDWVEAIDTRTGKKYVAHGRETAELLIREQPENLPKTIRFYIVEFDDDDDVEKIKQWVRKAVAAWDRKHSV